MRLQKSNEFYIIYQEIPQPSLYKNRNTFVCKGAYNTKLHEPDDLDMNVSTSGTFLGASINGDYFFQNLAPFSPIGPPFSSYITNYAFKINESVMSCTLLGGVIYE